MSPGPASTRPSKRVREAGVKLQIGVNRRFDSNFARVRRAVATGEIGAPHLRHIVSRDSAPPAYVRRSGGLFLDMTIHDFDMAASSSATRSNRCTRKRA